MSAGDGLRELITERLTAAAEDIFELVKTTIVEYKEELERQRKLQNIFLNPKVYLHRIDVPQQLVCKEEEVLLSKQLCNQDRNSSPHQEEAEPPWIKEEPEEPCSIQEGKQRVFNARLEVLIHSLLCVRKRRFYLASSSVTRTETPVHTKKRQSHHGLKRNQRNLAAFRRESSLN
ncbi:uncharacterized protein LOC121506283 isoform X3 [Cheilinus undulatus]|uniref:uncharacterized protein LOC121506283 isoform X3 n=1 Tax=Cheilinus undulatus TaxID=241271 RepID=UPI001BD4E291|nr:uncharacterized protein LOC121506283 isoform X3 [Cheilinus undulatus]